MRNALAKVSKNHAEMVAATIRTIFAQPDATAVRAHVDAVAETLAPRFPAVAVTAVADELPWRDSDDHGNAVERVDFFNRGASGGVEACLPAAP